MTNMICPRCYAPARKTRHSGYECLGDSNCTVFSFRVDNKGRLLEITDTGPDWSRPNGGWIKIKD